MTRTSKKISFLLRHHPEKIGIKLDQYGRVNLSEFIEKFNNHYGRIHIDRALIEKIMAQSDKQRYAIEGDTIRALYGHSVPVKPLTAPSTPPGILYHGTTHVAAELIKTEGIKKMDRDFVHLSATVEMAVQVGKRRDPQPVIFEVAAKQASEDGLLFYPTRSNIWLVDFVPAKYLKLLKDSQTD